MPVPMRLRLTGFSSSAPRVGLEPTTTRLTAECSTIELSRNILEVCTFKTAYQRLLYLITFLSVCQELFYSLNQRFFKPDLLPDIGQADDRLVAVSSIRYRTSTPALSTSSSSRGLGYLILRGASRLDAFSVYPFRTRLPGHATGMTAGTPAVRPSRSSRTKDSSSLISYARAG